MHTRTMILVVLTAALAGACGDGDGDPKENTSWEVDTIAISLADSIGIEMGDSSYVFGAIEGVAWCPDGNIAVMDAAKCCVSVFSREGEFLRQISRKGTGPGELQAIGFMAISADGHVYIAGEGSGILGLHIFDYVTGEWLDSRSAGGQPPTNLEGGPESSYLYKQIRFEPVDGTPMATVDFAVRGFDSDIEADIYFKDSFEVDFTDMTEAISKTWYGYDMAMDLDGRVFIAPRSSQEYRVLRWDSGGVELPPVELDLEMREKTEEEIESERMLLRMKASVMGMEQHIQLNPDPYRPMIRGLEVDSEGRLWVLRGGWMDPFFDVYGRDGTLLAHGVVEPAPADGATWRFHFGAPGILAYAEDPALGYQKVYILNTESW